MAGEQRRRYTSAKVAPGRDKVLSAAAAAALVRSGDTMTTSGFVGISVPDGLLQALAERFAATGEPRDLGAESGVIH